MGKRESDRRSAGVVERIVGFAPELRQGEDGSEVIGLRGHAAVFDTNSVPLFDFWEGSFVERIRPGAFTKTLREADVRLLINHDPSLLLARNTAGTLRLAEDATGLAVDADVAPTTYARDLVANMRLGNISQMSFAFRIVKESWTETHDGLPLRNVEEAALSDVSVVTYPAYPATDAGLRSRYNAIVAEISGEPSPDRYPLLRAAQAALAEVIERLEPPTRHSDVARVIDLARRRLDLDGRRAGYR